MKIKILLCSLASILIIGAAAGAYWWLQRPQVITFSDDAKLTLLSVEYGKHHAPPGVKAPTTAATTNRATAARRNNGSFTTPDDTLVVWVREEYDPQQYHYFQFYAYDKAGTACVQVRNSGPVRRGSNEVVSVQLDAFPRRQGKFYLRVQEQSNSGQEMADQKFVIANPVRDKSFTEWTPEPLPSTRGDDDLSVTLTKLIAGADMPYQRNQDDADDAANKGVQAVFHVERNGKPVTTWQPVSVETTDATGNSVSGGISGNQWQDNEDTVTYQYGLWPDEPAWKLKFEFSQQSDFADNELWTAQNIPVQPGRRQDFTTLGGRRNQAKTNSVFAETDLNGYHVKIFPAKQFTDVPANSQLQGGLTIQINPSLQDGMRMTFVKLVDNQGSEIGTMNYGTTSTRTNITYLYGLRDVSGATNLNLTVALHKSRFIEFTAKPEKEAAAAAQ